MRQTFNHYVKVDAATILPDDLKPWADYANYLQHRILVGRAYWQLKKNGFVSLHRRTLERAIHHTILGRILNWLITNNVIERDGSIHDWTNWKPARRRDGSDGISIGYRFCAAYASLPTQRVACRSVKANNKFLKLQKREERMQKYTKIHRHLRRWLRRLNLDLPTALKLVLAANLEPAIAKQVLDLSTYIANGDATDLTVCNYGRVHTAITRLLAPIRSCLTIGGQPLVELDIANSQPLFLAIFILQTIRNSHIKCLPDILTTPSQTITGQPDEEGIEKGIVTSTNPSHNTTSHPHPTIPPPHHLYVPRKSRNSDVTGGDGNKLQRNKNRHRFLPPDLLLFTQMCMDGSLYDHLMEQAGWVGDRRSFKTEFFHMLYGPVTDSPMTKVMQREFPSVMAFIKWHKRRRHGYKELAREMQRAESKLIIEGVCGRVMELYPNIPLVTVHDSILTTQQFVPTVRAVIEEEFSKLGINPTIKTKGETFESATLPSEVEVAGDFNPWANAA